MTLFDRTICHRRLLLLLTRHISLRLLLARLVSSRYRRRTGATWPGSVFGFGRVVTLVVGLARR